MPSKYSHLKLESPPSSDGIAPVNSLPAQPQARQTGELAEFRRNAARQLVVVEAESHQAGEVAEFRRNAACQFVVRESQLLQIGETAEFRRNRALQAVGSQAQLGHPALRVDPDTVPFAQRAFRKPAMPIRPLRPTGRIVECLEDVAVRQGSALYRALVGRDPAQPRAERRFGRGAQSGAGVVEHLEPQSTQRVWQVPGQAGVTTDPQFRQLSQLTKFRRKSSRKAVVAQVDRGNPTERVGAHAMPGG